MAELEGQLSLLDAIKDELEGEPTAARAIKILDQARELGWTDNPFASFTVRLTRDDGLPFFATWHMSHNPETAKRSWRFAGARASNGQALAYNDIKTYLNDPRVIEPEMPDELAEAAEHENPDQTEADALEALRPLTPGFGIPAPPTWAPTDWSALLGGA